MANFIISALPPKEDQLRFRKQLWKRIEELKKEGKDHDAAVANASVEIVGEISIWNDRTLGVCKESRIGLDFDLDTIK